MEIAPRRRIPSTCTISCTEFLRGLLVAERNSQRRTRFCFLNGILATATESELATERLGQIMRARDQLLKFCDFPGKVYATNNGSERALRPSVIQRKVTNGYRAKWAADAEADMRITVDTARLTDANPYHTILGALTA